MKAATYCRVSTDDQNAVAQFIRFASFVIARLTLVSRSKPDEIPRLRSEQPPQSPRCRCEQLSFTDKVRLVLEQNDRSRGYDA